MFLKVNDKFDVAFDKNALLWTIDYRMNNGNPYFQSNSGYENTPVPPSAKIMPYNVCF